ncbi:protein of unknown function [Bacteroides stercorirosoris]|jgi:hypothetical protein|uniref:DUF4369 domain-containing protein n=2 Tax=Bacteroides stercorirosoris TaxID=871324 RepID=A0A1M6K4Q7_9BACE|nr:protein of unknown function [Bacteroides stercorirosoris]
MNKSFLYLTILLFIINGCHTAEKRTMNIEGIISSAHDGQIMYLVPRPHPTPETVDSTYITNGTFFFSIPADSGIYDLTISRQADAYVQRLLIIAEEGTLHANMGTNSSSSGTPLNNQLQHWKEQMETTAKETTLLSLKINKNKENDIVTTTLKEQWDSICQNFNDSTFYLIKQNMNPLGGYLFITLENIFNEQQINELKKLGIDKWKPAP